MVLTSVYRGKGRHVLRVLISEKVYDGEGRPSTSQAIVPAIIGVVGTWGRSGCQAKSF